MVSIKQLTGIDMAHHCTVCNKYTSKVAVAAGYSPSDCSRSLAWFLIPVLRPISSEDRKLWQTLKSLLSASIH
jgi:uncharacterized membrane protein